MRATTALLTVLVPIATLCLSAQTPPQALDGPAVDWVYVVDTSLTMLGKGKAEGQNIFADVKSVMRRFLADDVKVGDTVRLVTFDSDSRIGEQIYIGTESAKDAVRDRIDRLEARGQYTYIAGTVREVSTAVASQPVSAGRTNIAVIFTDGIDEPPPSATESIDLAQALRGFPATGASFYFINLGTADAGNDLYDAFTKAGRGGFVRAGDTGVRLGIVDIPRAEPPLAVDVELLAAPTAQPGRPLSWTPFQITTNRPVPRIDVEVATSSDAAVEGPSVLGADDRRPQFTVTPSAASNNRDIVVTFVLRPAGATTDAVPIEARVPVRAPTFGERWGLLLWAAAVLSMIAGAGAGGYRWWTRPPVEGALLIRLDHETKAINLKQLKTPRLIVGRGGPVLDAEPAFRLEIVASGTRRRVERVTATLLEGVATLNDRPLRMGASRPLHHDDVVKLARQASGSSASAQAVVTYQNFKLQTPGSRA